MQTQVTTNRASDNIDNEGRIGRDREECRFGFGDHLNTSPPSLGAETEEYSKKGAGGSRLFRARKGGGDARHKCGNVLFPEKKQARAQWKTTSPGFCMLFASTNPGRR